MIKKTSLTSTFIFALLMLAWSGSAVAECGWGCTADKLTAAGENHRASGNAVRGIIGAIEGGIEMVMDFIDWLFEESGGGDPGGPNDPDFRTPASLIGHTDFELFEGDQETIVLANAVLVQTGLAVDNARLAHSSLRKYNGAVEAQDQDSADQRAVEGRVYLDSLEINLEDLSSTLDLLVIELDKEGVELSNVTFEELIAFRHRVIENGYPEFEQVLAQQMLITDEEMAGMLYVFEKRGLPGVGPDDMNDQLLKTASELIRTVDVRANLPAAFRSEH